MHRFRTPSERTSSRRFATQVESTTTKDWESLAKYSAEGVEDLRTLFKLADGYGSRAPSHPHQERSTTLVFWIV